MLLATDAQHAKEVALGELERVRALARQERENRLKQKREKLVCVAPRFVFVALLLPHVFLCLSVCLSDDGQGAFGEGSSAA